MLSKRYQSTEVDGRTWLHVPSGTLWSISSDNRRVVEIAKIILQCIHHFKSDLINSMDHMRISSTGPSSVILSKTKQFKKLKRDITKVPKQTYAKRDGVINQQNYKIYNKFQNRNI